MRKKRNNIICYILLVLSSFILSFNLYISNYFYSMNFEQILFTLQNSESTGVDSLTKGCIFVFFVGILIFAIIFVLFKILNMIEDKIKKTYFIITFKSKKYKLLVFPFISNGFKAFVVFIISIVICLNAFGIVKYIKGQNSTGDFYADNYVDPSSVKITFPKEKRNLIYIYLESMESTLFDKDSGGELDITYIPNLEKLAEDNINFSNNDKLGGFYSIYNTGFTVASLVAQTSGVTFNVPFDMNSANIDDDSFLPGATSIGEILEDNGYNNYFLLGSSAKFSNRDEYFKLHGNYEIFDYNWAIEQNKIDSDYCVWWGYEDKKLFSFAKEKLLEISNNDEPFNFTMLTADTHFIDGYLDETCDDNPFDSHYANSYHCSDIMVNNFIEWIKEQDFYEDTTIIIVGDHKTMQRGFFEDDVNRFVYDVIINSVEKNENTKNRLFSAVDMYPTTLASLGVKIDDERLGLGVNLYSGKRTILETFGIDYIDDIIGNKSDYYNSYLRNE